MLEKLLAYYCGPALAGIKPANIAGCRKSRVPDIHEKISRLNDELNSRDIYIEILCECEKRVLMMVYRKKVLKRYLQNQAAAAFLSNYAYPDNGSVEEYIACLKSRLSENSFPHEIGVFLGYPLHDIYGFINHRDEGCLLIGEWKVYENAEEAQKLFSRYTACRKAILKRVTSGFTLAQIFCAA